MFPKQRYSVWFTTFLWCICKIVCYDDFCDEPHATIYCTCDIKYMHTNMACYIHADLKSDDKIWTEMSQVENVITLTLFSRYPAKLAEIPGESLKRMPYLEILKVQQANLTELKTSAISDLKVLRELNLDGCEITAIQRHAITNMPKLKELSISDNSLEEILAESFTGLFDLEKLFLDQNEISRIESCAFCDLQNLRELELWANKITDLSEYMFRGLRYLKRLDISKNNISILNDKIFHAMPKLEELDLSHNRIYHVASRSFQDLVNLNTLNLQHNVIKVLSDNTFAPLKMLRKIILGKNELETFQVQLLEYIGKMNDPNFYLDIKDNPLVCDCRLSWVKKYMVMDIDSFFKKELQQLECRTKENITLVHLLDMDCSKPLANEKKEVTLDSEKKEVSLDSEKREVTSSQNVIFDLIPHEMHKIKNKTRFADAESTDDVYVNQDSEMDIEEAEVIDSKPSSSGTLRVNIHIITLAFLVTVLLVRKRKGTCLC